MLASEQNSWSVIRHSLAQLEDIGLQVLLDSSQVDFDGQYTLTAEQETYTGLCQYFPLLETVVQDISGQHLRLNLKESVPMGTDRRKLSLEIGVANVSDAILAPESIAAVPSYLLRFVPYVGSASVLIATALRQAFYRASREHGADQLYPKSGDAVTIDVQSLLNSLGNVISRAKFFRIFKEGGMDWFVQRGEASHHFKNGHIQRQPNTYHYRGLILTSGDAADLYNWLLANGLSADPIQVLSQAILTPRDQILQFPYRLPKPTGEDIIDQASNVHSIVEKALFPQKMNATLAGLCDRLAAHLIRPESFLAVPWYWFHKVLPELGDDLGMLYLMSKRCCYIDWARGKDRNTFWVPGGLPTLQGWIRSETLPKRIPHAQPSTRGRPRSEQVKEDSAYTRQWRENQRALASQYLCRLNTRESEQGSDWQLRVDEVQLTAADETLKQAVYAFLYAPPSPLEEHHLRVFADNSLIQDLFKKNARAHPQQLCHFETLVNEGLCQNETLDSQSICHFDTLTDGLNYYFETLIAVGLCQFDTIINILIKIKNAFFFNKNNSTADTAAEEQPEVVELIRNDNWDFEAILGRINPILKKRILDRQLQKQLLSWLIEASLTASIHSPLSLAVTRVLETETDAGGASARLADLPALELAVLLRQALRRLEGAYLGSLRLSGPGAEDLTLMLSRDSQAEETKQLVRRLCDLLSIR